MPGLSCCIFVNGDQTLDDKKKDRISPHWQKKTKKQGGDGTNAIEHEPAEETKGLEINKTCKTATENRKNGRARRTHVSGGA